MTTGIPSRGPFPAPTTVSEHARRVLSVPPQTGEVPAPDDAAGWLALVEQTNSMLLERFGAFPLPVTSEETTVSGVRVYVLRPDELGADSTTTPVLLSLHGGALVYGAGQAGAMMSSVDAVTSGMLTWSVDYRMPPEHPFPAGLDDCVAVYRALLTQRAPEDIFVAGTSAGGNLACALLLRAREEGLPMPAGLVLLSPMVDLTEAGDTFTTLLGVDNVLSGSLLPVSRLYAAGRDLADPLLSPLNGDLSGFPPTFLQAGTRDLFLSNTVRMHRKLRAGGVSAQLHVFEAMPHGGFSGAPEDAEVAGEVRRFVDQLRRPA